MRCFSLLISVSITCLATTPARADYSHELAALQKQLSDLQKKVDELTAIQAAEVNLKVPSGNLVKATLPKPSGNMVVNEKNATNVVISGQINRMIAYHNNGNKSRIQHLDSSASSSRITLIGETKLSQNIKAQAALELEWLENASQATRIGLANNEFNSPHVGQDQLRPRKIEGVFITPLGTFSIGKGHTASYGSASATDFSKTSPVSHGSEGALDLGGFNFYNKTHGLTELIPASSIIDNYDGIRRADRIRYDTPEFYGFKLGIDHTNQDTTDAALYYNGVIGETKVAAAFGFVNAPYYSAVKNTGDLVAGEVPDLGFRQYTASFGVLFPVGVSFSATGAFRKFHLPSNGQNISRNHGTFWSAKLGYQRNLFGIGDSVVAVEYAQGKAQWADSSKSGNNPARIYTNFAAINGELARSYALTFVQNIDCLSTELYLTFRMYSFSRPYDYVAGNNFHYYRAGSFDRASAIAFGTRIKF